MAEYTRIFEQASKQASMHASKLASKHNSALLACQAENCTKTEGVFCPFYNGWDAPFYV